MEGRGAAIMAPDERSRLRTVTRAELLDAVYAVCPNLTRGQARAVFEMMLEEVGDAFVRGEAVRLRSFGAFNIRSKRERIGRNPKTGVEVPIRPRRVVTFKASPVLIARANNLPFAHLEKKGEEPD